MIGPWSGTKSKHAEQLQLFLFKQVLQSISYYLEHTLSTSQVLNTSPIELQNELFENAINAAIRSSVRFSTVLTNQANLLSVICFAIRLFEKIILDVGSHATFNRVQEMQQVAHRICVAIFLTRYFVFA